MPASIQGVPTFQHWRLTQSRASRLSRQPMTRSTSAKSAQAQVGDHVAVHRDDPDLGVQLAGAQRGDLGLGPAAVLGPEQHRPRQVRRLDDVQVDHVDRPQAHQRQVLQDLVAQRTRADDQHPRRLEPLLPPPGDQPQAAVPVQVVDDQRIGVGAGGRSGRLGHRVATVRRSAPGLGDRRTRTVGGAGRSALFDEHDLVARGARPDSRPAAISRRTSAATSTVSALGGAVASVAAAGRTSGAASSASPAARRRGPVVGRRFGLAG